MLHKSNNFTNQHSSDLISKLFKTMIWIEKRGVSFFDPPSSYQLKTFLITNYGLTRLNLVCMIRTTFRSNTPSFACCNSETNRVVSNPKLFSCRLEFGSAISRYGRLRLKAFWVQWFIIKYRNLTNNVLCIAFIQLCRNKQGLKKQQKLKKTWTLFNKTR